MNLKAPYPCGKCLFIQYNNLQISSLHGSLVLFIPTNLVNDVKAGELKVELNTCTGHWLAVFRRNLKKTKLCSSDYITRLPSSKLAILVHFYYFYVYLHLF